jgi:hypothetical protein
MSYQFLNEDALEEIIGLWDPSVDALRVTGLLQSVDIPAFTWATNQDPFKARNLTSAASSSISTIRPTACVNTPASRGA